MGQEKDELLTSAREPRLPLLHFPPEPVVAVVGVVALEPVESCVEELLAPYLLMVFKCC